MSNKLPYIAVPITKLCQQNQRDHYQVNCIDRSTCFPDHKYGGSSTDFSICVACCSFSAVRVDLPSRHPLLERVTRYPWRCLQRWHAGLCRIDLFLYVMDSFSPRRFSLTTFPPFRRRISIFYDGDVVSLHTVLSSSYSTFTYLYFQ